jgi:hypothetical protein
MSKCFPYLLVALAEIALALPQGDQAPFSITINGAKNVFEAGSEVRIRLVFKNTSGEEIPYGRSLGTGVETQGELFTDVEVRDAKGGLMPKTKYYRALRGEPDTGANLSAQEKSGAAPATSDPPEPRPTFQGSFVGFMLKPGESREEEIVVSKLYDLGQPGQFAITTSRRLSVPATDPRSKLVAKSNTLMITIVK